MSEEIQIDIDDVQYFKKKLLKVLKLKESKEFIENDELDKFLKLINKPLNQYISLKDSIIIYHEVRPPENKIAGIDNG